MANASIGVEAVAKCKSGHTWTCTKVIQQSPTSQGFINYVTVVKPATCPACSARWSATEKKT